MWQIFQLYHLLIIHAVSYGSGLTTYLFIFFSNVTILINLLSVALLIEQNSDSHNLILSCMRCEFVKRKEHMESIYVFPQPVLHMALSNLLLCRIATNHFCFYKKGFLLLGQKLLFLSCLFTGTNLGLAKKIQMLCCQLLLSSSF